MSHISRYKLNLIYIIPKTLAQTIATHATSHYANKKLKIKPNTYSSYNIFLNKKLFLSITLKTTKCIEKVHKHFLNY